MADTTAHDVMIVGGGPAGLSAGIFTARAGLETVIVDDDESILRRNAFLENYPGFPAGVHGHLLLDMMVDQAERAGCAHCETRVTVLESTRDGFVAETEDGRTIAAASVVAATKNTVGFLEGIDGVEIVQRGKQFVETDDRGRTGIPGLYAAGRLARQPYQVIVVAGHGASVGLAVVEDADVDFYHDWIAPERYFTGRGRDVPPGCEEIDDEERTRREAEALAVLREYLTEPHPGRPVQHPSVREE